MIYAIKTSEQDKQKAIKEELAEQADGILTYVKQYHTLGNSFDYDGMLDKYN